MHVAVDVTACLTRRPTGIARYASSLAVAMDERLRGEGSSLALIGKLSRISHANRLPPTRHAKARWWTEHLLPLRTSWDLVHYTGLIFPDRRHPVEVHTLHDLHALNGLSYSDPARRQRKIDEYSGITERAAAIVCVSRHTADEAVRLLNVRPEKLCVVPLAVGSDFSSPALDLATETRNRYGLASPYFFCYGHASQNKNIDRILKAFAVRESGLGAHQLVFVGGWSDESHRSWQKQVEALGIGNSVRHLGRIPDADLIALLSRADALVFPSLGEGFGLPILEAFACGTPVLTSMNGGATAEVANGYATLVDACDVASIASGLAEVVRTSAATRDAAMAYARSMTWDRVAERTLEVYRHVLEGTPSSTRLI